MIIPISPTKIAFSKPIRDGTKPDPSRVLQILPPVKSL